MKIRLVFLLTLISSCSSNNLEYNDLENEYFKLKYPKGWTEIEEEGIFFAIKKHDLANSLIKGENPNLAISISDKQSFSTDSINTFSEFKKVFKDYFNQKSNWSAIEDDRYIKSDFDSLFRISFFVESEIDLQQDIYLFENIGKYIAVIATYPKDNPDKELNDIISSIEITDHSVLENLIN